VFELHQLTEAGVGPFDLQAYLSPHAAHERLIQRLGIFRRCHLSPFLREKDILTSLKKLKPRALICLPSLLSTLAHENIVSGIGVSIDKIFSTSEVLSAKARAMMARAFGSEIYDMYGAMETSWIAWQCEKGSLHLHSDSIIAEIVDDGGNPVRDGGYGNIVLTPLLKRSMPLVRYYLGDRTAFGSRCACGRGLHVLKPIEGRDDDFIVLPSGRLSPARFIHWGIRDMPEVLLFQAIQEKSGELCIKIVPSGKSLSPSKAAEIVRNLKGSFPEPMEISVEQVESLPRGKTGKIQAVISKVRPSIGV
jgi:phenylacetate-CoA ligase